MWVKCFSCQQFSFVQVAFCGAEYPVWQRWAIRAIKEYFNCWNKIMVLKNRCYFHSIFKEPSYRQHWITRALVKSWKNDRTTWIAILAAVRMVRLHKSAFFISSRNGTTALFASSTFHLIKVHSNKSSQMFTTIKVVVSNKRCIMSILFKQTETWAEQKNYRCFIHYTNTRLFVDLQKVQNVFAVTGEIHEW